MERVTRIDFFLSGDRGYLHTRVSLREALVADLPGLLNGAQQLNPAIDVYALVRAIWRLGGRAVQRNTERGIALSKVDLPLARITSHALPRTSTPNDLFEQKKWRIVEDRVSGLRPSRI
jgi:hypothetical protein